MLNILLKPLDTKIIALFVLSKWPTTALAVFAKTCTPCHLLRRKLLDGRKCRFQQKQLKLWWAIGLAINMDQNFRLYWQQPAIGEQVILFPHKKQLKIKRTRVFLTFPIKNLGECDILSQIRCILTHSKCLKS